MSNKELFKQALVEGVSRHFDKTIEEEKQIEEIGKVLCKYYNTEECNKCGNHIWCSLEQEAQDLYNAGYRKQIEGEWIKDDKSKFKHRYYCSVCGFHRIGTPSKYCEECGSKMKGGERYGRILCC